MPRVKAKEAVQAVRAIYLGMRTLLDFGAAIDEGKDPLDAAHEANARLRKRLGRKKKKKAAPRIAQKTVVVDARIVDDERPIQ